MQERAIIAESQIKLDDNDKMLNLVLIRMGSQFQLIVELDDNSNLTRFRFYNSDHAELIKKFLTANPNMNSFKVGQLLRELQTEKVLTQGTLDELHDSIYKPSDADSREDVNAALEYFKSKDFKDFLSSNDKNNKNLKANTNSDTNTIPMRELKLPEDVRRMQPPSATLFANVRHENNLDSSEVDEIKLFFTKSGFDDIDIMPGPSKATVALSCPDKQKEELKKYFKEKNIPYSENKDSLLIVKNKLLNVARAVPQPPSPTRGAGNTE